MDDFTNDLADDQNDGRSDRCPDPEWIERPSERDDPIFENGNDHHGQNQPHQVAIAEA